MKKFLAIVVALACSLAYADLSAPLSIPNISSTTGSGSVMLNSGPTVSSPVISNATASTLSAFSAGKVLGSYAGSSPTACSNQFMRAGAISAAGVLSLTCATVGSNDLASSLSLTTPNIGAATGTSLSLNNAAGIPLAVYGYSTIGGAGAAMGELRLGNDANAYGALELDTSGSTRVYVVNGYNNAATGGIALRVKGAGTPVDVLIADANGVSIKGGGNSVYYCDAGVSAGVLCRGNGCSCVGGSLVATSLKVD